MNPYVQKFSKAFNIGLSAAVFLSLLVIASCHSVPAHAQTFQSSITVVCSDISQLNSELQDGSLKLISFNPAEMLSQDGQVIRVTKMDVMFPDGNIGNFVVDSSGATCLLFQDIPDKVSSK